MGDAPTTTTTGFQNTTTTRSPTTTSLGSYCDELCITNNVTGGLYGEYCSDQYCLCMNYGNTPYQCDDGMGWCQASMECIQDCDDTCGRTPSPFPTTTSEPMTTSGSLCDELCEGQGDLALSDGCCTDQFCQCTNGQESYLTTCKNGEVFCNAWEACVDPETCYDNQNHCCENNLNGTTIIQPSTSTDGSTATDGSTSSYGSTATDGSTSSYGSTSTEGSTSSYGSTATDGSTSSPTTTTTFGSYCDELCVTNNVTNNLYGEHCSDQYCQCMDWGNTLHPCEEEGQGWCPDMMECVDDCGDTCGGETLGYK